MKNRILLLSLILMTYTASGQWHLIDSVNDSKTAMAIVHPDSLFYTSYNLRGEVIRLAPQRDTLSTLFTSEWFLDIQFPEPGIGYLCGGTAFGMNKNCIAKTTDYGKTWDSISANQFNGYNFKKLSFLNKNIGLIGGDAGYVLTHDGGQSFQKINIDTNGLYTGCKDITIVDGRFIVSEVRRVVVTHPFMVSQIMYSDDQGITWTRSIANTDTFSVNGNNEFSGIKEIHFIDNQNGYAVGADGQFLKTQDKGSTWQRIAIPLTGNITSVNFTSLTDGFVCHEGDLYKTKDGGNTWHIQVLPFNFKVSKVDFFDSMVGYALGGKAIYKTTQFGDPLAINSLETSQLKVFPNPAKSIIKIEVAQGIQVKSLDLFDATGRHIQAYLDNIESIDISKIDSGAYMLILDTNQGQLTKKIMIK